MTYKTPVHLLKGIRYIDNLNIEERLLKQKFEKLFDEEYFVDFSQVGYVELSGLAKILLIIENYLKNDITIFIALPTIRYSIKEEQKRIDIEWTKEIKENLLKSRIKANSFIKTTGFVSAVQQIAENHNKNVYITEDYDFESEFNQNSFSNSFSEIYEKHDINEYTYKYIMPFQWIDCSKGLDGFEEIEKDFNKIIENPERGLDQIDVKAIKNVILSELIKNVKEHSGSKYALLAIGLINSKSLLNERQFKRTNPIEKKYLNWIDENNFSSQVEIYFGDSGFGIFSDDYIKKYKTDKNGNFINKEMQLELAFERWTTRKNNEPRRGTKGLYRIQRIINKYNGIVHIETDDLNGGFIKGGYPESTYKCRKTGKQFHGTLVNIKLNPFKEVKSFKYIIDSNRIEKQWNSSRFIVDEDLNCQEQIKNKIKESKNLLLILNVDHLDDEIAKSTIEKLLPEISYDSHPCAVVIYLISNLRNDTLDTIIDSANTVTIENFTEKANVQTNSENQNEVFPETINESADEIYDPVLVIGDKNAAFWYGGTKELVSILSDSFKIQSDKSVNIEDLEVFKGIPEEIQLQIKLHLQNDNKLVNLDTKNTIVFNFQSIDLLYEKKLLNKLSLVEDKMFCTPKLHLTNNWVNISELLSEDEFGFALCLYLKYQERVTISEINKNNTFILIDHQQQSDLAKAFASLLGINRKNIRNTYSDIDANIPKRTKLFPEYSNVIILTTIISSSETVRRLVKFVNRDFANADCILCLANLRKYNINSLETWNKTTDIITCFQKNKKEIGKETRNDEYFEKKISRINKKVIIISPEFEKEENAKIVTIDSSLKEFIRENKLLHYNHVGVFNKRHFTFFIDKQRLLDIESIIWRKIESSISEWKHNHGIDHFRVFVPKSILNINGAFANFLTKLANARPVLYNKIPNLINEQNVFYFDFGMLTGDSVNSFITSCQNVENLFACILFDQSINTKTDFYRRIETVNNLPDLQGKLNKTQFQINYLFDLPLNFFSSENCPICEHSRALNIFKLDQAYLFKFSKDRQERLKQIHNDEIKELSFPVDFYFSEKDVQFELSSTLIMKMYEFKILFENARESTTARISIYKEIFALYYYVDSLINDCESNLYALLYYLSYEINWFQQEPLVFRDLRFLISELALKVANYERVHLIDLFSKTNKSNTTSDKLAVRYKYAAISVLRSTDKLKFCENIAQIVESSELHNKYSDNLFQNTLYHISSLHNNRYNQSKIYFKSIEANLESLTNKRLSLEQKLALQKIAILNKKRLKEIESNSFISEFRAIKNLKNEILKTYSENHPTPIEFFNKLYLSRYESIFKEYSLQKENARNYSTLREVQLKLANYWISTIEYIKNSVLFYLEKLEDITSSQFYRNNFSNIMNLHEFNELIDRFSELVYLIEEDLNNYVLYKQEYDLLYDRINNLFIKSKGFKGSSSDSKILNLISHFPTNLQESIDTIFPEEIFSKRKLDSKLDLNIFYPQSEFLINLDLVRNNIERKKNSGIELESISINFNLNKLSNEFSELIISYDSTDLYKQEESKSGSLTNWKNEILFFKGTLDYKTPNDNNKWFVLKLKLLNYE